MSSGQQAAEDTKGAIKGVFQAGEDARKEVNSFADNLLGGNKEHASTGFSQDAKAVGNEIDKEANTASAKAGESAGQAKRGAS